eukprot:TRINITY_DN6522_c1_g1_i1.p1 TRINITY_DN6522_c1_g1~~TRINITY_DN6522_c1_g1_i1.p1  ORF type:complete len:250 (+),score=9.43 TRINITY_DN6522_c1_g1_i1:98-847(+)
MYGTTGSQWTQPLEQVMKDGVRVRQMKEREKEERMLSSPCELFGFGTAGKYGIENEADGTELVGYEESGCCCRVWPLRSRRGLKINLGPPFAVKHTIDQKLQLHYPEYPVIPVLTFHRPCYICLQSSFLYETSGSGGALASITESACNIICCCPNTLYLETRGSSPTTHTLKGPSSCFLCLRPCCRAPLHYASDTLGEFVSTSNVCCACCAPEPDTFVFSYPSEATSAYNKALLLALYLQVNLLYHENE